MIFTQWLDSTDYPSILDQQHQAVLKTKEHGCSFILATEHQPCITLGRRNRDWSPPPTCNIPSYPIKRGGLATYHGPGQLTVYPIVELERYNLGVRRWVSIIEQSILNILESRGIQAYIRPKCPGVYTPNGKIASIGLHILDGVSMHGFSIMVHHELDGFKSIVPCGVANQSFSSIELELGVRLDIPRLGAEVMESMKNRLANLTEGGQ